MAFRKHPQEGLTQEEVNLLLSDYANKSDIVQVNEILDEQELVDAILYFKHLILEAYSGAAPFPDAWYDVFSDTSSIDDANSSDYYWESNGENKYLYNTDKTQAFSLSGGGIDDTLGGGSIRQVIQPSSSGSTFNITLESVGTLAVNHVSIVERDGSTANGTGLPTEITFNNGQSGFDVGYVNITSDNIDFPIDSSKEYLLIIDFSATTQNVLYDDSFTSSCYFKASSASYEQQNVTGFTLGDRIYALNSLDIITVLNPIVQFDSFELDMNNPNEAIAYIMHEPKETIELNTDIIIKCSIDGGTTWETGVLEIASEYSSSINILKATFSSITPQDDATSILKIECYNNKGQNIHGVSNHFKWSS